MQSGERVDATLVENAKQILRKTPDADIVFRGIVAQREQADQDLRKFAWRVRKRFNVELSMEKAESVYGEFQRVGWGKLSVNRGTGQNSRFRWKASIPFKEVIAKALDGSPTHRPIVRRDQATAPSGEPIISFQLPSGRRLELTPAEARALKDQLAKL